MSLESIIADLKSRKIRSKELVETSYAAIQSKDKDIQSFLSLFKDRAIEEAEKIDARLDKGDALSPLAGIPIAIKDNIHIKGEKTTCASKILEGFVAPFQATVMNKVFDAGLIPVGKVNMDEFAMGSSTEHSAFQVTKNPWDMTCVPGGSSGGSAAAVAANFVPLSLGSDTGGSIRQPAAYCGVVGLKPSYGRVSRYGLVAFASSLDQIGPFGKTVKDVAHLLTIISGHDPLDSTSEDRSVPDFVSACDDDISGKKVGVPKALLSDKVSDDIKEHVIQSLDILKDQGVSWDVFDFGHFDDALSAYYILAPAEASANLERYDGVRYGHRELAAQNLRSMYKQSRANGFGDEVIRRILLGTFVLSSGYYDAYYVKAQKVRTMVMQKFNDAFSQFDVLAMPTTPTPAFKLGEHMNDPSAMYVADIATIPVNLAGLPGISIPCGHSSNQLPIGLQLVGKRFDEASILAMGHRFQSVTDFHLKEPQHV